MTDDPSTPIDQALDVSKDERAALDARTPPYDGVRTYADLCAVRALGQETAPIKGKKKEPDTT